MTKDELIKQLELLNGDAEIVIRSSNFEHNGKLVSLSGVTQYNTGRQTSVTTRDAFDGYPYKFKSWELNDGDIPIIILS